MFAGKHQHSDMLLIQILIYSKLRPSFASEIIMTVIATLTTVFYGRFVILFSVFETLAYATEMCIVVCMQIA